MNTLAGWDARRRLGRGLAVALLVIAAVVPGTIASADDDEPGAKCSIACAWNAALRQLNWTASRLTLGKCYRVTVYGGSGPISGCEVAWQATASGMAGTCQVPCEALLGGEGLLSFTVDLDTKRCEASDYGDESECSVEVVPNHAPDAGDDAYTMAEGDTLHVGAPGVLGNDSDADGEPLTASVVGIEGLVFNADGSFTYTPPEGATGAVAFTYAASDGCASDQGVVTITIIPAAVENHPPLAVGESYTINQGWVIDVAAPGLLANDTDPDGDALTAVDFTQPTKGWLWPNADGSFAYQPFNNDLCGDDAFTYRVFDGELYSDWATVKIHINCPSGPSVTSTEVPPAQTEVQPAEPAPTPALVLPVTGRGQ